MFNDIVSPFCACTCDDLSVRIVNGQLIVLNPCCPATTEGIQRINQADAPPALQNGVPSRVQDALSAAARLLGESRFPLLFGMGGMGTNSQRAAVRLAEQIGGVIDTAGSGLSTGTLTALQQVGMSTCTLGEILHRADLVLIWGADPAVTHPRFFERLIHSKNAPAILVLDDRPTATSSAATRFHHVPAAQTRNLLLTLRQLLRDEQFSPRASLIEEPSLGKHEEPSCSLSASDLSMLRQLSQELRRCKYGVILYGDRFASGETPALTVELLFRLVEERCAETRMSARPLGEPNAENLLAWQTGFARAVHFHPEGPESLVGEFSANEMLERRETDCAVILGSRSLRHLSASALTTLREIPTILLEPASQKSDFQATVQIAVGVDGIHSRDTIYRFDDVSLPLRSLLPTELPSVSKTLAEIGQTLFRVPHCRDEKRN